MARKHISLWSYDNPESTSEVLLVRLEDEETYREFVAEGAAKRPDRLFMVMPAGYGHEATLAHYVKYTFLTPADGYAVSLVHQEVMCFFHQWEQLGQAFNAYDSSSYRALRASLLPVDMTLVPGKMVALQLLDEFADNVITPITECAVFVGGLSKTRKTWWRNTPDWLRRTRSYRARLRSLSGAEARLGARFEKILDGLAKAIAKLDQPSTSLGQVFYSASAYAFSLAELRVKQKRGLESCILSHRAIDMYLQYLAIGKGILAEFPEGLEYVRPDTRRDMVTLLNTEFYLIRDGLTPNQGRFDFLLWLNDIRNSFLYMHGLHGVLEAEAQNAIQKLPEIIRSLGDTGRWRHLAASYFSDPIVDDRCLFELEDGFDTYVKEAST